MLSYFEALMTKMSCLQQLYQEKVESKLEQRKKRRKRKEEREIIRNMQQKGGQGEECSPLT